MNHSIKEMVDAAVKRFSSTRFGDNEHQDNKMEEEMCTWLQKTLTSITENAVASERARLREGVEGMKRKHWVFECNGAHGGKGCYETFCDDKSRLGECTSKDAQTIRAHNAALTATLEALEKI